MTERIERFLEDNADGYRVVDYPAAVDALVATGLLGAAAAESWKAEHRRLRAAAAGLAGPYDPEVEAMAVDLVEALFAAVRPKTSEEWDPVAYQRYQEALSALTGIGALSFERAQPWFQRQMETLTPAGGPPEPAPVGELPFSGGDLSFSGGALSAVLVGSPERLDGMRVTCLELYADCAIVRYHQRLPPEPADPVERRLLRDSSFALDDDAGTRYEPVAIPTPGGCRPREVDGWPELLVGWQAFSPGAPLDARTFTVTWRARRFAFQTAPGARAAAEQD